MSNKSEEFLFSEKDKEIRNTGESFHKNYLHQVNGDEECKMRSTKAKSSTVLTKPLKMSKVKLLLLEKNASAM